MGKPSLLQEISVGIMSSMIILPPVILMVSLFRKLVFQHQRFVYLFFARSIPSGKKKSRFDKVFNEHFKGL